MNAPQLADFARQIIAALPIHAQASLQQLALIHVRPVYTDRGWQWQEGVEQRAYGREILDDQPYFQRLSTLHDWLLENDSLWLRAALNEQASQK